MDIKIDVLKIRLLPPGRTLRAFADVRIDDWIVHDFRILKNGQKLLVTTPQISWKDPETGEIRFKGILTIPPEQKQEIEIAILHAYQTEMENLNAKQDR